MKTNTPLPGTRSHRFGFVLHHTARAAFILLLLLLANRASAGTPIVNVSVSPSPITSAYDNAVFTVTLSEPTPRGISIAYFMSGGARSGSDYVLIGNFDQRGHIVIPAGQTSGMVTLHTLFKDPSLPQLQATLNLLHGAHYRLGSPKRAQVDIELP